MPYPRQPISWAPKKQEKPGHLMMNRVIIAVAVAGWAVYGLSTVTSRSSEAHAEADIGRWRQMAETAGADYDALAADLEQFKQASQDLQHIQRQIAAATQELQHLEYLRGRISGQIDAMRPQPSDVSSHRSTPDERSDTPNVASIPPSQEEVSKAQQALTMLGLGSLKADGVLGPGTRRAIEAFQRTRGLRVTGQLEPDTLRAINDSRTAALP
jgi:murein L,D-transpeptidase YcbB/YkuD